MSTAVATNAVSPAGYTQPSLDGIGVNSALPVGALEQWKRETITKLLSYAALPANWDGHGSRAPSRAVRQTAYELIRGIPAPTLPVPRVVPVSGGGYHFEWAVGARELEVSIDAHCRIESLRVHNGVPEDEAQPVTDVASLFGWLNQ